MGTHRIAIVGDTQSVAGFRPLGFAVYPIATPAEARGLWSELTGGGYAAVLVTDAVHEAIADLVADHSDIPLPAVTVIPGAGGVGGTGQAKIDAAIERALGTKVFIREEDG